MIVAHVVIEDGEISFKVYGPFESWDAACEFIDIAEGPGVEDGKMFTKRLVSATNYDPKIDQT